MAKKQPLFVPNGVFHVFNHANGWEDIFKDAENFRYFLQKMGECVPSVVDVLTYCLLPNHFHLLIQVKNEAELVKFYMNKHQLSVLEFENGGGSATMNYHKVVQQEFSNFLGGYVLAFNKYHGRKGSLLQQNTCRKIVGDRGYFLKVIKYIHYNAVHHGFVAGLEDWPHHSYHSYLSNGATKLAREKVLNWFGGLDAFIAFHQTFPVRGFGDHLEG